MHKTLLARDLGEGTYDTPAPLAPPFSCLWHLPRHLAVPTL